MIPWDDGSWHMFPINCGLGHSLNTRLWLKSPNGHDVTKLAIIEVNCDVSGPIFAKLVMSQPFGHLNQLSYLYYLHAVSVPQGSITGNTLAMSRYTSR